VVAAIYLSRRILRRELRTEAALAGYAAVTATLALAAWLVSGIDGRTLPQIEAYLPPVIPMAAAGVGASETPTWLLNDYDGALALARSTRKSVFVDFTGYTCTNCRWMEANIFSRPDVSAELGNFVLSRLYTDGDGEIYEKQQAFQEKNFGTVALPLYAVIGPDGKTRATFSGLTRNPAEFVAFLRSARERKVATR
jgi:thiol:disulfide interchange protein DsbD